MARIVIIGKRSLLAERFQRYLSSGPPFGQHEVTAFTHDVRGEHDEFDGADVVVNFAFHPRLRMPEPYIPDRDIDLALAERLPPTCRYVMLSSRLVYGPYSHGSRVSDIPDPATPYGRNKLRIELRLHELLGDRLTVLRISNPLLYRPSHPQFVSTVMDRLQAKGEVQLDLSPFVRKDFVPEWYLMSALTTACTMKETGIFNVGSGQGVEIGQIALWIIEGYGAGRLVITDHRERDEFWLDMSKSPFGIVPSRNEIKYACLTLGRSLGRSIAP